MNSEPPRDHARSTYDAFAAGYDVFTSHHRYDEWTATLEGLARQHGLCGKRMLDVACGTGKSFLPFLARGYDVTACDVSPEMVHRAREKTPADVRLEVHDMRELPVLGEFDLVCCLDDAVNYLLDADDLEGAFRAMAGNMPAHGVLVFDVNSLRSYRSFWNDLTVVQTPGTVVVLEGRTAADLPEGGRAVAAADVLSVEDDGSWRRSSVVHHQRHFPRAEVEAALHAVGLEVAGLYGLELDGAISPDFDELGNSKAVYVSRRAKPL